MLLEKQFDNFLQSSGCFLSYLSRNGIESALFSCIQHVYMQHLCRTEEIFMQNKIYLHFSLHKTASPIPEKMSYLSLTSLYFMEEIFIFDCI